MRPLPRLPPDVFGHVGQYLDVADVAKARLALPQVSRYPESEQFIRNTEDPETLLEYYQHSGDPRALLAAFDLYLQAPHIFEWPPIEFEELFTEYVLEKARDDASLVDVLNFFYMMPDGLDVSSRQAKDFLWSEIIELRETISDDEDYDFYRDTYGPYKRERLARDFQELSLEQLKQYPMKFLPQLSEDPLYTLLERFSDQEIFAILWANYEGLSLHKRILSINRLEDLLETVDEEYIERFANIVRTFRDFRYSIRPQVNIDYV